MANYKSIYTGEEIDAGIAKANTAIQDVSDKQDTLVSGTNIKTINGNSVLGSGNLVIEGGGGGLSSVAHDETLTGAGTNNNPLGVDTTEIATKDDLDDKQDTLVSGTNIKTINNETILGSGNITISGGSDILQVETITIDDETEVPVTGLELDYNEVNIDVGTGIRLACTVLPANASNKNITWSVVDSSIATVDGGQITGVANGTTTVTATSVQNPNIIASCTVNVGGSSGTKIYLKDLTPTGAGKVIQIDNSTEFSQTGANYYEVNYTEGMQISCTMHAGWIANYRPFIVITNGTVSAPQYNDEGAKPGSAVNHIYTATLSGYSAGSTVKINTFNLSNYPDDNYYEIGGNE